MDYDVPLKTLLMDGAPAFLAQLAGTPDVVRAPAEFPAVVSRTVALLGDLPDRRMLHTEVQSGNDPDMPCRMLGYYWMILEGHRQADVVQIVLDIGQEP